MEKPDFEYYETVVKTQRSPDILQGEMSDLMVESENYIKYLLAQEGPIFMWGLVIGLVVGVIAGFLITVIL